jgi:hypothetical protein
MTLKSLILSLHYNSHYNSFALKCLDKENNFTESGVCSQSVHQAGPVVSWSAFHDDDPLLELEKNCKTKNFLKFCLLHQHM